MLAREAARWLSWGGPGVYERHRFLDSSVRVLLDTVTSSFHIADRDSQKEFAAKRLLAMAAAIAPATTQFPPPPPTSAPPANAPPLAGTPKPTPPGPNIAGNLERPIHAGRQSGVPRSIPISIAPESFNEFLRCLLASKDEPREALPRYRLCCPCRRMKGCSAGRATTELEADALCALREHPRASTGEIENRHRRRRSCDRRPPAPA